MSQFMSELCALLIEDTYGEFFSHIFSALTKYGRLTLPDLARHCQLPTRHVRTGLSALIQAHLVHHYTTPAGQPFYSANLDSAYHLVRTGKVLRGVEDRIGKYEAEILFQILLLGDTRVNQLAKIPSLVTPENKRQPNGDVEHMKNGEVNGTSKSKELVQHSAEDLLEGLQKLSDAGLVQKVRSAHFRSDADNREDAERHVQATQIMVNAKGKKWQEEFDHFVEVELKRRRESAFAKGTFYTGSLNGLKRGGDFGNDAYPRKRTKLSNGAAEDGPEAEDSELGPTGNIILQFNHAKFSVLMRNQRLVALAERNVGRPSAKVYRAALQQVEGDIPECRSKTELLAAGEPSDYPSPLLDVDNLVRELDPKIRLDGTVAHWTPKQNITDGATPQPVLRRKRPPDWDRDRSDDENDDVDEHGNISGVDHDSSEEDADRDFRPNRSRANGLTNGHKSQYENVMQHLHLLAEAPEEFVTLEYDSTLPSWQINYQKLASELRNQEIFAIISDQFGNIALRLIRVLMNKGKLEEKALQELALMSAKDLRQTLARLKTAGYLELQEVPREAQRQPSRTIYLWFYDPDRARRKVLEDTYKSMARIIIRIKAERKKIQGVLDKAERTDVKGHEEELLSRGERKVLNSWREMEEAMWGEIGRLDDLVAILRDF